MESIKVQVKKGSKAQKHGYLRKMAKLLRYVEVCVVVVLISRLSIHLPMTLKNSSEYFRNFMGSPRFVFLVGNVIIITLLAQSGHFSAHTCATTPPEPDDLYSQFLHNSTINQKIQAHHNNRKEKLSLRAESQRTGGFEVKDYRRCQSEIVKRLQPPRVNTSYPEDGMSNDEFRRKVEAFIARQQRLRIQDLCN